MSLPRYTTIEKAVGETPLQALERARAQYSLPNGTPLAYAGRLDPMASGLLLILVGEECKVQEKYHSLDKIYEFSLLLGVHTDTGDVLGRTTSSGLPTYTDTELREKLTVITKNLIGDIEFPYPHFSSKTVHGKPLHVWALENRLHEITIPTQHSHIYSLTLDAIHRRPFSQVVSHIQEKINTIPTVTEVSKELGNDFRRADIRSDWETLGTHSGTTEAIILDFSTTVSSGTYIRSLAPAIAEKLGTCGLAYSIHRTKIGRYQKLFGNFGFWRKIYS